MYSPLFIVGYIHGVSNSIMNIDNNGVIMKIHMLKDMLHDRLGKIKAGRTVVVDDNQAKEWLQRGWAQAYDTKVIREIPLESAGVTTQSSALPVEEASPKTTLKPLKRGGRPKKVKTEQ